MTKTQTSSSVFVQGISREAPPEQLAKVIEDVFLLSTNDLSWLSNGETVLLKPALNSPDPYPATTHPLTIRVIHDVLTKRGAKVIIADQSGIEHVLHQPSGVIRGSTKKCYEDSGMAKSGVQLIGLETRGWDGFYHFDSPDLKSWNNGFYITDLIQEADHIINLPRCSTHAQTGVTLGFKNLVGLLREDSRVEFHSGGPFHGPFFARAYRDHKSGIVPPRQDQFFEKIVEISLAIKDKLRLTLFTGTRAQVTIGPDADVAPLIKSKSVTPETGLVFASDNQVAAEAFAIAFLTQLYQQAPIGSKLLQKALIKINGQITELGKKSIWQLPFIRHACDLNLGLPRADVTYADVPEQLRTALDELLQKT